MQETVFFFIHGAWSSPACFNYLRDKLEYKYRTFAASYDCQKQSMSQIIQTVKTALYGCTKPEDRVIVVGHSLGGLVALMLEKEERVKQIVTIASPLSGIHMNRMVEWFLAFKAPIFHNITENSVFLRNLHSDNYTKPIHMFAAVSGFNPMMTEPNDGVVTVASQETWIPNTATLTFIEASHFDVLQHDDTVIELKHIGARDGI